MIKYAYLWRSEAERGQEERQKDRPCAIVLAVKRDNNKTIVVVAPITHSPPRDGKSAIEIPSLTKQRLGLDDGRSWLRTNDLNTFTWPGTDVRPIDPARGFAYGYLPSNLTKSLIRAVREQMRLGKEMLVKRT